MSTAIRKPDPDRILLTPEEAAFLLGASRSCVFGLLKDGRLASTKLGRYRRIHRDDVVALAREFVSGGEK